MNRTAPAATAVVLLNLLIATAHGVSHARAAVPLEPWQHVFVRWTVYILPVLSVVLYRARPGRLGAALLCASMLAGLVFGGYFHFMADTADHVSHRASDGPGTLFVVTAGLLIPAEMAGAAVGAWSWFRLRRGMP